MGGAISTIRQRLGGVVHAAHHLFPTAEVNGVILDGDPQGVADDLVETLGVHIEGNVIDAGCVHGGDNRAVRDVTHERNLALESIADGLVGAADNYVRLDAVAAQLRHRVLRRLRLLFTRRREVGHQG